MPGPLPLNCLRPADPTFNGHSGTGFLVSSRNTVWLVTCVHIVTGRDESPLDAAPFIGAHLHVLGTEAVIPFYRDGQKRFTVIRHDPTMTLVDVMAITLSQAEIEKVSHFGMFDIDSIVPVAVTDEVSATGFPGLQTIPIPETTLKAQVTEIVGISLVLSKPSAAGLSGSPLVSDTGLVGIVHGDRGTPPNYVYAQALAFDSFKLSLFQIV